MTVEVQPPPPTSGPAMSHPPTREASSGVEYPGVKNTEWPGGKAGGSVTHPVESYAEEFSFHQPHTVAGAAPAAKAAAARAAAAVGLGRSNRMGADWLEMAMGAPSPVVYTSVATPDEPKPPKGAVVDACGSNDRLVKVNTTDTSTGSDAGATGAKAARDPGAVMDNGGGGGGEGGASAGAGADALAPPWPGG